VRGPRGQERGEVLGEGQRAISPSATGSEGHCNLFCSTAGPHKILLWCIFGTWTLHQKQCIKWQWHFTKGSKSRVCLAYPASHVLHYTVAGPWNETSKERNVHCVQGTKCLGNEKSINRGLEGLAPSMWAAEALFLCGSWASCQFLAHIHCRKFATGGCVVSPRNMVSVITLPCKILITTLPICLYMFTTINNNKYKNICTLDMIHVKKRHNTGYGTLLKCYPWL